MGQAVAWVLIVLFNSLVIVGEGGSLYRNGQ